MIKDETSLLPKCPSTSKRTAPWDTNRLSSGNAFTLKFTKNIKFENVVINLKKKR